MTEVAWVSGVFFFPLLARLSRAARAFACSRLAHGLEPEVLWKPRAQASKSLQEDELLSVPLCLRAAVFINLKLFGC